MVLRMLIVPASLIFDMFCLSIGHRWTFQSIEQLHRSNRRSRHQQEEKKRGPRSLKMKGAAVILKIIGAAVILISTRYVRTQDGIVNQLHLLVVQPEALPLPPSALPLGSLKKQLPNHIAYTVEREPIPVRGRIADNPFRRSSS